MMQTPEIKTNDQGIKTLVEAITKPIQKSLKKRSDNFKNQSKVAQSKELMKASGKQERKTVKAALKAEGKQTRKNMRLTADIAGANKPGTRKSVSSGSMSISQTTAGGTTTAPKAKSKTTTTSNAKFTATSSKNTKPKTSSGKVTRGSSSSTRPRTPANRAKAPRGR